MCAFQWAATIFSATGETLHKHKFAFNASLLRLVKRTLERVPSFCSFLLFFASLRYSLELGAAGVIVVPVVVCFQTSTTAAAAA